MKPLSCCILLLLLCNCRQKQTTVQTDTLVTPNASKELLTEKKDTLVELSLKRNVLLETTILKDTFPEILNLGKTQTTDEVTDFVDDVTVSDKWLEAVAKFKHDSLPDYYTSYLRPLLVKRDELSRQLPSIYLLEVKEGNLDEDEENEKILFFKYPAGIADACHTLVLKHRNTKWVLRASVLNFSRYSFDEVLPDVFSKYKVLVCKSGDWGSCHNGNYFHFYKIIQGKLKSVLDVTKVSFFCQYQFAYSVDGEYRFLSAEKIGVNYKYSFFQMTNESEKDGSTKSIDILKNRATNISFVWNKNSEKFEVLNKSQQALVNGLLPFTLHDTYTAELLYLKEHGTDLQKNALKEYFKMKK